MTGKNHHLVLCGIKHCGKTTLGKLLAAATGRNFIDSDDGVCEIYRSRTGKQLTPREIYLVAGEEYFRQLEAETVTLLAEPDSRARVIALGGGVLDNSRLGPDILKRLGTYVYLKIEPEIAYRRIEAGGLPPFLSSESSPFDKFLEIYGRRDGEYRRYARIIYPVITEVPPEKEAERLRRTLEKEGVL